MAKKKAAPEFDYPGTFDRLMGEHFGEKFSAEWSIFAGVHGGYCTVRENGRPLTKGQAKVGRTISNALSIVRGDA